MNPENEIPSEVIECCECEEPAVIGLYCEDCHAENFTTCDVCNQEVRIDSCETLNREITIEVSDNIGLSRYRECNVFCNRCRARYLTECDSCQEYVADNDITNVQGESICENCYDNNCSRCDSCGERYFHNWYSNQPPCGCMNSLIHDYSYKPTPIFHGKPLELEGYLGVELEVNTESEEDDALTVLGQLGGEEHIYLKEDGSIGRGFEIVTHPHTFSEQVKLWSKFDAPEGMSSAKSGRCGLHVHYSREGLSQLHINRMVVFLNAPENLAFMEFIAARPGTSRWAEVKSKTITSKCYERYEALNLCNKSTIEFRIFKGNTRIDRIMKCLEFVVATVAWTRDRSYRDLGYKNYIEYILRNAKQYPNLKNFIVEEWGK